jgi:hypothetical protein
MTAIFLNKFSPDNMTDERLNLFLESIDNIISTGATVVTPIVIASGRQFSG